MPYKVDWLIKDEVVLLTFWGVQEIEDLRESLLESRRLKIDSPLEIVHSVADIRKLTHSVKMQDSMRVARELGEDKKSQGWAITVGKIDIMTKMGIAVTRSVLGRTTISFETMDEAFEFLKEKDENLSWDKINVELLES